MRFFASLLVLCFSSLSTSVPFRLSPLFATSSAPSLAKKIAVPGISNAGKVSDSLFRGAQPNIAHLDELKNLSVTTIVDLRSEAWRLRERERQKAESLGIHFVSIPVGGFSPPTSEQLAKYFSILRQAPLQKIFVHCKFGEDRTGVFIASYRIAFEHWTADQALSEMRYFGFNQHWQPAMAAFIRALPDRIHSDPTLISALEN